MFLEIFVVIILVSISRIYLLEQGDIEVYIEKKKANLEFFQYDSKKSIMTIFSWKQRYFFYYLHRIFFNKK